MREAGTRAGQRGRSQRCRSQGSRGHHHTPARPASTLLGFVAQAPGPAETSAQRSLYGGQGSRAGCAGLPLPSEHAWESPGLGSPSAQASAVLDEVPQAPRASSSWLSALGALPARRSWQTHNLLSSVAICLERARVRQRLCLSRQAAPVDVQAEHPASPLAVHALERAGKIAPALAQDFASSPSSKPLRSRPIRLYMMHASHPMGRHAGVHELRGSDVLYSPPFCHIHRYASLHTTANMCRVVHAVHAVNAC